MTAMTPDRAVVCARDGGDLVSDRSPEAGAQVRILPGAPCLTCTVGFLDALTILVVERIVERASLAFMAARRRPRGHIETLPSGSYRAVVYTGVDPLTRRGHQLKETHASRDAAEKALTRMQHPLDTRR
jgi:hypothetical protein